MRGDGYLVHAAEGLLGGAMGTLFIDRALRGARHLPEALKPTDLERDPGDFVVSKVEALRHRTLPRGVHERMAHALHWAYGIGWGGLFGLALAHTDVRRPRRALLAGAALGAAVWAVGYAGWLPAAGLARPLRRQGLPHALTSLLTHVGYGVVSSLPVLVLERAQHRTPLARARRALRRLAR